MRTLSLPYRERWEIEIFFVIDFPGTLLNNWKKGKAQLQEGHIKKPFDMGGHI